MNIESHRDLQLLRAVENDSLVTQRTLADRFGMALGLTNTYLKRLAKRGYIKCLSTPSHRLTYIITSRGLARRIRLTREFIRYSLALYAVARRQVRQTVQAALSSGERRIALYGTDETAEVAYLCLKEVGVEPVAIFSNSLRCGFLGLPVRHIRDQHLVEYDLVLVASFEQAASAVNRLVKEGVPREKVVHLASTLAAEDRSHGQKEGQ